MIFLFGEWWAIFPTAIEWLVYKYCTRHQHSIKTITWLKLLRAHILIYRHNLLFVFLFQCTDSQINLDECKLDFILMGFATLFGTWRKWHIKNKIVCLQRYSNQQPLIPYCKLASWTNRPHWQIKSDLFPFLLRDPGICIKSICGNVCNKLIMVTCVLELTTSTNVHVHVSLIYFYLQNFAPEHQIVINDCDRCTRTCILYYLILW